MSIGVLSGICFGLVMLAWIYPGVGEFLLLDRGRVSSGEVWRLFTHPLVHFSAMHLAIDVGCLVGLGLLAARMGIRADWRWVVGGCAVMGLTGMTCLMLDPRLERLGGLSGLNVAMAVRLGTALWMQGERPMAMGLIGGLGLKLVAGGIGMNANGSPSAKCRSALCRR